MILPKRTDRKYLASTLLLGTFLFFLLPNALNLPSPTHYLPWTRHSVLIDDITWSNYAYYTHATTPNELCNAVMLLEALQKLHVRADRVLLYAQAWDVRETESSEGALVRKARDTYGAKVLPISVEAGEADEDGARWLVFNQTQYTRVLALDSAGTLLRSMDELFLLPAAGLAAPRAYGVGDGSVSADVMLVRPSRGAFERVREYVAKHGRVGDERGVVNVLFGRSALVLPARPYELLSGEFRNESHAGYLGGGDEVWSPMEALMEAKYVHFSDKPLPRPWEAYTQAQQEALQPKCARSVVDGCAERTLWNWLYADFRERRLRVCGPAYETWMDVSSGVGVGS